MKNWFSAVAAYITLMALSVSVGAIPRTGGTWEDIPNTHMRDVCADLHWPHQNGGCEMVINAWSGAAWDAQGRRMFVFGGGHGDYYGNEVYEFSLADRAWRRLTNPTPLTEGDQNHCVGSFDGNKTPTARHSYNMLAWIPTMQKMIMYAGGVSCRWGSSVRDTWSFDPASAPNGASIAWQLLEPQTSPPSGFGPLIWDSSKKTLYLVEGQGVQSFNFDLGKWIRIEKNGFNFPTLYRNAALDTKRDRIWFVGTSLQGKFTVHYLDLRKRPYRIQQVLTTGLPKETAMAVPGLAYDSKRDELVAWCAGDRRCTGGKQVSAKARSIQSRTVYSLDLSTLIWSVDIPPVGPSWNDHQRGTFGRWQYSPKDDVFVGVNSVDHDVWLYHPPTH